MMARCLHRAAPFVVRSEGLILASCGTVAPARTIERRVGFGEGGEVMVHTGLKLMLLLFALIGYAGAGASLAVARQRFVTDLERDLGMIGVSVMLIAFATLCVAVATGLAGVLAFGAVTTWVSYTLTAQRFGLFRIETGSLGEAPAEETRRTS
jgi:hypothetical protein